MSMSIKAPSLGFHGSIAYSKVRKHCLNFFFFWGGGEEKKKKMELSFFMRKRSKITLNDWL